MANFAAKRVELLIWKPTCSRTIIIGMLVSGKIVKDLARQCGFELAGVSRALPVPESEFFMEWVGKGMAGEMRYLTGSRATARTDPTTLLPSARSMICVGKLYNGPEPYSTDFCSPDLGWISRYAWGDDYHDVLHKGLSVLAAKLCDLTATAFEWRICVDTAPLLERAYARHAGLGWIGKNTCLINEQSGSWFFLGELLVSMEIETDSPPAFRCGSCTRCIDACPTGALVPTHRQDGPAYALDSRRCISYFTVELRGPIPQTLRSRTGNHIFGCDICQDVCPWNRRAPATTETAFAPRHFAPPLERMAALSETEFREIFRGTPVPRARYTGFLRNVAVAMGNSALPKFRDPLEKLAAFPDPVVAEHARWALEQIK